MSSGHKNNGGGVVRPLISAMRWIDRLIEWSGSLVIFATLLATFLALLVNVFLRYVMGEGIAWAYEIHSILFPWLVAGGIAIASVKSRHISVDLLMGILPDPIRRWAALLVNCLVCAIAISVLVTSQPIINASKFQRLSEIPVSQYWGYISLYYAFFCMAVNAALNAIRNILGVNGDQDDASQVSYS